MGRDVEENQEMMNTLISIIIPVYQAEETIERCLHSIVEQTYSNLEIILIDDGSTDKSGEICDIWAEKDCRIRVIHQKNQGTSIARNIGIDNSCGKWICFIDGDDWVEPKYISYLLNLVESNNCEIGMNKNNYSDYNTKSNEEEYVVSAEKAIEWIYLETHFDEPRSMVIRKTLEFKKTAKTGGIRYSVMRKKLECIHTLIMGGVFS